MKRLFYALAMLMAAVLCAPNAALAADITNAMPIQASGQQYDFEVPAKDSVFFQVTTGAGRGYYSFTFYNPGSNSIDYNLYEGPGTDYAKKIDSTVYSNRNSTYTVYLQANSNYYLEAYSYYGSKGRLTLSFIPDDFGNSHSEATPLAFGQMVEGAIEVSDLYESDFFCFTTDGSDSYYEIGLYGTGSSSVSGKVYYGPDESYESFEIYAGSGTTSTVAKMLEKNHTYYYRVMGRWNDATRYKVSVKKIADDASNDFKGAKKVKDGKIKKGRIEVEGDVDFYKFVTPKNKTAYQVTLRNTSQSSVRFTLYTRNDIASANTYIKDYYVSSASSQTIWLSLSKKHTYYMKVYGGDNATYAFTIKNSVGAIKKACPTKFHNNNYYGHACLNWNNTGKYTGYEIFRSTRRNGGYKKIKTLKDTGHYDDYSIRRRQTYYYKIRYYVRNNGKVVGGKFSKPIYVRLK